LKNYFSHHNIQDGIFCKAPFASIYINNKGEFLPCCWYDPYLNFGKYPETSIQKALKTRNRRKLQANILSGSLSQGCTLCELAIHTNNPDAVIASQYKNLIIDKKFPFRLEFDLSHFCNLDCIMCGTHSNSKADAELFSGSFLKTLKPFLAKASQCNFYGGEPFLIPVYFQIFDLIGSENKECEIYIQTNGTVFNKQIEKLLNTLNINLGISLDAINPELFEMIRRHASYDLVKKHIEIYNGIMRSQNKTLTISISPMSMNLGEIPDLMNYCNQLHAAVYFNTVNYPKQYSLSLLPSRKLNEYLVLITTAKYFSYNNPAFEENNNKLHRFIQMMEYYAKRNEEIENNASGKTLSDVVSGMSAWFKDSLIANRFLGVFDNYDKNMILSPLVIYELTLLDRERFSKIISKCIEENNTQTILNITGINTP
jgi:MoaA/NifB/PqqE/SkfB family radical SAM enzyme